ncbi:MAG: hypothetical protein HKL95_11515 [Phycisphaerae bacterium]|nr:hypothetical protein [Phycisphaerae bacterium]
MHGDRDIPDRRCRVWMMVGQVAEAVGVRGVTMGEGYGYVVVRPSAYG